MDRYIYTKFFTNYSTSSVYLREYSVFLSATIFYNTENHREFTETH